MNEPEYNTKSIEQLKVVWVLTELCKLVMRPPYQLSAVTNKLQLFPTTMDSECAIRPRSVDNYFEIVVKKYIQVQHNDFTINFFTT